MMEKTKAETKKIMDGDFPQQSKEDKDASESAVDRDINTTRTSETGSIVDGTQDDSGPSDEGCKEWGSLDLMVISKNTKPTLWSRVKNLFNTKCICCDKYSGVYICKDYRHHWKSL